MACEILVLGQELGRLVRRLDIPNARMVEGRLSCQATCDGQVAAVMFDSQALPLHNARPCALPASRYYLAKLLPLLPSAGVLGCTLVCR